MGLKVLSGFFQSFKLNCFWHSILLLQRGREFCIPHRITLNSEDSSLLLFLWSQPHNAKTKHSLVGSALWKRCTVTTRLFSVINVLAQYNPQWNPVLFRCPLFRFPHQSLRKNDFKEWTMTHVLRRQELHHLTSTLGKSTENTSNNPDLGFYMWVDCSVLYWPRLLLPWKLLVLQVNWAHKVPN